MSAYIAKLLSYFSFIALSTDRKFIIAVGLISGLLAAGTLAVCVLYR